jgi:hypothetical protein
VGCKDVCFGRWVQTFRKNVLPPSSGYKRMPYGDNGGIQRREGRHQGYAGANRNQWSLQWLFYKGTCKGGGKIRSILGLNAGERERKENKRFR